MPFCRLTLRVPFACPGYPNLRRAECRRALPRDLAVTQEAAPLQDKTTASQDMVGFSSMHEAAERESRSALGCGQDLVSRQNISAYHESLGVQRKHLFCGVASAGGISSKFGVAVSCQ